MSQVRNRVTGKSYERSGAQIKEVVKSKSAFFQEHSETEKQNQHKLIKEFIADFKTRLPNDLSQEDKDQLIEAAEKSCRENFDAKFW